MNPAGTGGNKIVPVAAPSVALGSLGCGERPGTALLKPGTLTIYPGCISESPKAMDIHPPKNPIHSLKDFLRELVTIIAGILIALSLDGLVAWREHRNLAGEASANIITEVRENQKELGNELNDLAKMQQQSQVLVELVHNLQSHRNTPPQNFQLIWSFAELHATSWDTAARTGALSYMPYAQVKGYTQVYDLQRSFTELQQRSLSSALEVEGLTILMGRDRKTISSGDLAEAERKIGIAVANIRAMQQIATALGGRYAELLKSGAE